MICKACFIHRQACRNNVKPSPHYKYFCFYVHIVFLSKLKVILMTIFIFLMRFTFLLLYNMAIFYMSKILTFNPLTAIPKDWFLNLPTEIVFQLQEEGWRSGFGSGSN